MMSHGANGTPRPMRLYEVDKQNRHVRLPGPLRKIAMRGGPQSGADFAPPRLHGTDMLFQSFLGGKSDRVIKTIYLTPVRFEVSSEEMEIGAETLYCFTERTKSKTVIKPSLKNEAHICPFAMGIDIRKDFERRDVEGDYTMSSAPPAFVPCHADVKGAGPAGNLCRDVVRLATPDKRHEPCPHRAWRGVRQSIVGT